MSSYVTYVLPSYVSPMFVQNINNPCKIKLIQQSFYILSMVFDLFII